MSASTSRFFGVRVHVRRPPPAGVLERVVYGVSQPLLGLRMLLTHRRLLEAALVPAALLAAFEGGLVVSPNENQRRAQALRKLLGTAPPEGKNVIIVSHKPNLQDAAGKDLGDVAEAEVVVFQPQGEGKFKVMARVPAPVWTEWSK